jgi:hypothetical protein
MKHTLAGPVYEKHELKVMLYDELCGILEKKNGVRDALTHYEWEMLGNLQNDAEVQEEIEKRIEQHFADQLAEEAGEDANAITS